MSLYRNDRLQRQVLKSRFGCIEEDLPHYIQHSVLGWLKTDEEVVFKGALMKREVNTDFFVRVISA